MKEARRPTTAPSASTTIQPLVMSEALAERVVRVRIGISCLEEGARIRLRRRTVKHIHLYS
jgi:hypothetical protein